MKFTARHFDPMTAGGTMITGSTIVFPMPSLPDSSPTSRNEKRRPPGPVYLFSQRSVLAVNAALATKRPLLVSGEPGSGKTALASSVAAVQGWAFYDETITSTTRATDLQWRFDALRRLNDAYSRNKHLLRESDYVEPGVLWWAFNPESAAARARHTEPDGHAVSTKSAVVLLDEIDKADPDVPNDLLEPFDSNTFTVRETGERVVRGDRQVLLILTTNGEREMPPAFLRRCIRLTLGAEDPTTEEQWFVDIADHHFGSADQATHRAIAAELLRLRKAADDAKLRRPGTAEFLDAIRVCNDLELERPSLAWREIVQAVLWKHEIPAPTTASAA